MNEDNEDDNTEKINILLLGNSMVGKTSFILKYVDDKFQESYVNTVGIDFKVKNITINKKNYKVIFYDTTGQEKYKSISLNVIKDAHGIILMYDITDEESFKSIPDWIQSIRDNKGNSFPLILLGNKIDKQEERKIKKEEGKEFADNNGIEFFETSNQEGINIQEAAMAIINKIIEKRKIDNIDMNSNCTSKLKRKKVTEKSKRCC